MGLCLCSLHACRLQKHRPIWRRVPLTCAAAAAGSAPPPQGPAVNRFEDNPTSWNSFNTHRTLAAHSSIAL